MNIEVNGNSSGGYQENPSSQDKRNPHAQNLKKQFMAVLDSILSLGRTGGDYIDHFVNHNVKNWWSEIERVMKTQIIEKKVDFLTLDGLAEIIKTNKVPESNQCLVGKTMNADGSFNFLATFYLDDTLLAPKDNVNILIKTDGVSRELKEEFKGGDFIILK